MRVIIAGSRKVSEAKAMPFIRAFAKLYDVKVVLCGMARGVDRAGRTWARKNGITVEPYPAKWDGDKGKNAGFARNQEMVDADADAALVIHVGTGGSYDIMGRARAAGLLVVEVRLPLE